MPEKRLDPIVDTRHGLQEDSTPEIVRFWILRILVRLGASRRLLDPDEVSAGDVLAALGIPFTSERSRPKHPLLPKLRTMLASYPASCAGMPLPETLASNIERVGNLLGLSEVERRLLTLATLARTERSLISTMEILGCLPTPSVYQAVACLIDARDKDVREALSPRGTLCRTGLLSVDRDSTNYLHNKIDVLSDGFAERMTLLDVDPADLLRDKVLPCPAPTLAAADFRHAQMLVDVAREHLCLAVRSRRQGTNVLIYGAPGVGKTELARVLAAQLGVEIFEISCEDDDGDPLDGDRRLRAYRAAQWFFSRREILFLFDEAEDVFSGDDGFFHSRSSAQRRKAWMNRTLEQNPIPTIWISNRVESLDPAFIRRFDVVLDLPNPPRFQREKIIRQAAEGLDLKESTVARLASNSSLTPAVVTRAAEVAVVVPSGAGNGERSAAMELLVNSTLRAQGHPEVARPKAASLVDLYDPGLINADTDVGELAKRLAPDSSARILLYGPPGTGKTAYAHWLTERLGLPLLVKRASDLLSMYVGQVEKNMAGAFEEAEREGAVLLLDEVDSFLHDRSNSTASWEVTMVNEMLTQMESFPRILIASTNLAPNLDRASLRRFDLKIAFQYLKPEQSLQVFARACELLGLDPPGQDLQTRVRSLPEPTFGEYAVALRQHALAPMKEAIDLYRALAKECSHAGAGKLRIGFV